MEWPEFIERFEVRLPFRVKLDAFVDPYRDGFEIRVALFVKDVLDGKDIIVTTRLPVPPLAQVVGGESGARELVFQAVRHAMKHELEESVFVDGKQEFAPHAHEATYHEAPTAP